MFEIKVASVQVDVILLLISIICVPLLVFGFCWFRATQIAKDRTPHNARLLARKVTTLMVTNVAIAITVALLGVVPLVGMVVGGAKLEVEFLGPAAMGLFLGIATRPMFKIRTALRAERADDDYSTPVVPQRIPEGFGLRLWILIGIIVCTFTLFLSLGLFVLAVLFFGLIPLVFWQRRRGREGQLLWLLALSVRGGHNLAQEVDDHAATWSGSYAVRLRQLAVYLKAGRPLGMALERVPLLLPRWVIASIKIGDETGTLCEVLNECSTAHLSWMKNRFRSGSIGSLLIYLACYPWVIVAPVSFVMYYIVPKFKAIFEGFGTELPTITERFINVCDSGLPYLLLFAPLSLFGIVVLLRFDHSGWRNLRIPLLRVFYPRFDAAPIMRHLARTIDKGKTLPDGLLAIANSYHRPTVANSLAQVFVETESGGDCWKSLLQKGFLSRRDLTLIEAAQRSGNLPWALREIADVREKRYIFRVDTVVQLFRPFPIIAIGILVGWICIALFMPIVKLLNDLS